VFLERGASSCTELQVFFFLQRPKGRISVDARDFNNIETQAVIKIIFLQGKLPKGIHAIPAETLGDNAPSYATVRNWVTQFERGEFFHLLCASSWTNQDNDHPGDY